MDGFVFTILYTLEVYGCLMRNDLLGLTMCPVYLWKTGFTCKKKKPLETVYVLLEMVF